VAVVGASTGRGGTRNAQAQVRDALLFPGAVLVAEPEVAIPLAWERFDENGDLTDERMRNALRELLAELADSARARPDTEPVLMEA
jgi:chromate reductase